jgi:hypothetical protein
MAAYGKTWLQLTNAVLQRLRKPTVATTSNNTYSVLIASMVNTIKDEVEEAHEWRDLRNTFALSAVPGTTLYTFTASGQQAKILDMWNTTHKWEVVRSDFHTMNRRFFGEGTVDTGPVTHFLPAGLNSSYDLQVDIWPSPSATNALRANLYVPQDDLTVDSTVVLAPNHVIIEGALAMAMMERGGQDDPSAAAQLSFYRDRLAGAIALELSQDPSETNWYPV